MTVTFFVTFVCALLVIAVAVALVARQYKTTTDESQQIKSLGFFATGLKIIVWSEGVIQYIHQHYPQSSFLKLQNTGFGLPQCISFDLLGHRACVVSCCDNTFPVDYKQGDLDKILAHEIVFAQNLDRTGLSREDSLKVRSLPIGLDLHSINRAPSFGEPKTPWRQQIQQLATLRESSKPSRERIPKVVVTWTHTSISSARFNVKSRPKLYDECTSNPNFVNAVGSRTESWNAIVKYGLVYSPIGNGFDCHRTWEAIALGCIVIAQTNPTLLDIKNTYPEMPIVFCDSPGKLTELQLIDWLQNVTPLELNEMTIEKFIRLEHALSTYQIQKML